MNLLVRIDKMQTLGGKHMTLVVASRNAIKLQAAATAFTHVITQPPTQIIAVAAESGVNQQPIGFVEILAGAKQRLAHAKRLGPYPETTAVYIAFESGLVNLSDDWIDIAVVVVAFGDKIATSASIGVSFPKEAVDEAARQGFETTTVGKVMEEQGIVKNHADPHVCLTHGYATRESLLAGAAMVAFAQLMKN